jgi:hypothetical protein
MRIHKRRAKERRRDIKLMLLGSGQRLSHRKNVRRKLLTMGFKKVIIMEDIVSKANKSSSYGRLEQKFEWLMKRYNPRLFFAFFHNEAPMDAVIFEIGCICCRYGSRNIGKKLRFMFEKNYNYRPYLRLT